MDIRCIEQCVNASFNADICRSCERTRPLIVVKEELPDNNLIMYLEGIANSIYLLSLSLSLHTHFVT